MSLIARIAAWRGSLYWHFFQRMTTDPEAAQQRLLTRLLAANRDTAFGRAHHFAAMRSVDDYRQGVPIADYEAYRPWVDRIRAGETTALTADPPYMFTLTSGTAGQPKYIPVNQSTRRTVSRGTTVWLYHAQRSHPGLLDGKAVAVVSPAVEGYTPAGIPYGSQSGYICRHSSRALCRRYAVPYEVFCIPDYEARYYAIMRFAVEQNVSFIVTPNPGTILRLVTTAEHHREGIIRDIHDGSSGLPTVRCPPNPQRARELSALQQFRPRDYWPALKLIGCWKGGTAGLQLSRLTPWFGTALPCRDLGYLSSEATCSLPIQDAGSGGILNLYSNFYEFIPASDSTAAPLTAGQVESGASYYILPSSPNGLYRYDINDIIRVTGFYHRTPIIAFVRKGRDMVNLEGEKLHVDQLMQAMTTAQQQTRVQVQHFRGIGNVACSRYDIQLELGEPATDQQLRELGLQIDTQLARLNMEYQQKRNSGRLHPPTIQVMTPGWSARRHRARLSRAPRDAQLKDSLLSLPDADDHPADIARELSLLP